MTVLRGVFFASVRSQLSDGVRGDVGLAAMAFLRGLWLDNVTACYILLLPLVVVTAGAFSAVVRRWAVGAMGWFFGLLYTLVWAATAANIPYFAYFTKILNSSIWNWAEYGGTTVGMMLGEASYYIYIGVWVVCTATFALVLRCAGRQLRKAWSQLPPAQEGGRWAQCAATLALAAAMVGACFFGIRGRMGYNPIKVSAAYFCNDPILNQLGINPMFALLQSTLDDLRPENRRLHLMDDAAAVQAAQRLLGRTGLPDVSPLARRIQPAEAPANHNVVLVLMESMSAELTGALGGTSLTPNLDSLAQQGRLFTNCYSAGNHTNHGLYATLYSFPSILKRNAMKGSNIPRYDGLATVLRAAGYRTLFFMTHESQYDNMNAFLRTNGYDEIYSQENYPKREVVNSFGVPDHYLYRYALGRMAQQKEPFMATLLSISNHPPYIIPEWFHPNADEEDEQIVEYADDALRLFFKQAEAQPWYEHTVFVLLGDHGKLTGTSENEMPQCLNHIPLIIHAPGLVAEEVQSWCMQMDVQPTLLSMLGITAHQENFGQNVLQHPRSMALYTADNVIGARTDGHLYVYEPATHTEWLYRTDADGASKTVEQPDSTFLQMKEALFSTLQTAQEEIKKHE